MIGYVVKLTISDELIREDGTYGDDWIPQSIREDFFIEFSDALNKYIEHWNTYGNHKSWNPGYIHGCEENKVFGRIVHEGRYGSRAEKVVLQIEMCFCKKDLIKIKTGA